MSTGERSRGTVHAGKMRECYVVAKGGDGGGVAEPGGGNATRPGSAAQWRAVWLGKLRRLLKSDGIEPAAGEAMVEVVERYLRCNPYSPYHIHSYRLENFLDEAGDAGFGPLRYFYERVAPSESHVDLIEEIRGRAQVEESSRSHPRSCEARRCEEESEKCVVRGCNTLGPRVSLTECEDFAVHVPYNRADVERMRAIGGARWSKEKRYWVVASGVESMYELHAAFGDRLQWDPAAPRLLVERQLRTGKYSQRTVRNYLRELRMFAEHCGKAVFEATGSDVQRYLDQKRARGLTATTLDNCISALRFCLHDVLKCSAAHEVKRPRRGKYLPRVLGREQVWAVLRNGGNLKHRALLAVAYGGGLRVNELVHLKTTDLDFQKKMIRVRGKGNKERYTLLADEAARLIRRYQEKQGKDKWLFPGRDPAEPLSGRSAQKVFKAALRRAGIDVEGGIHTLRHSFGTHLIEDGYSTRYVQELLGHKHINTTEIYTHVANTDLQQIRNPLDKTAERRSEQKGREPDGEFRDSSPTDQEPK